jgi:CheY-like chemotaxis protein
MHSDEGPRRPPSRARVGSVLVVDDESDVRDIFRELLQEEGYGVAVAHEGQDALGQLAVLPRPCTVLLDLQMPGLDGPGFLAALDANRTQRRGVHVIVVTARVAPLTHPLVVRTLRKPVDLSRLLELLEGLHTPVQDPPH